MTPPSGLARSLTGRRWIWRAARTAWASASPSALGVPEIVGRLLAARGIGLEAAAIFLTRPCARCCPTPRALPTWTSPPNAWPTRRQRAETVGVFGDYDVDGACSGALMTALLRTLGCTVHPYVPDRLTEGYGPNAPALRALARARRDAWWSASIAAPRPATCWRPGRARRRGRARPPQGRRPAAADRRHRQPEPAGLRLRPSAALRRRGGVPRRRRHRARLRRRGFFAARRGARSARPARSRGTGDRLRRDAADRPEPRPRGAGAAGDGAAGAPGHRRAAGSGAEAGAACPPRPAVSCLGPRINAAGRISEADLGLRLLLCHDPAEAARPRRTRSTRSNRQRQEVEAAMLEAALRDAEVAGRRRPRGAGGERRRLASRRGRHRRRADQGAVQPPGLRRRRGRGHREGLRPLGARGSTSARR